MKKILVAVMLTLVSACSTLTTPTQRVQATCASITASVQTLTIYANRLTPEQTSTVNQSLEAVYPVCGQGPEPSYDGVKLAALQAVSAELSKLILEIQ